MNEPFLLVYVVGFQAMLDGIGSDILVTLSPCKLWVTRFWIIQPEFIDFVAGSVWTLSSLIYDNFFFNLTKPMPLTSTQTNKFACGSKP